MNIWRDRIFRLFIHRSVRGVCPRTPREIRLYQDEREIRARNGTGGGHGLLKNEEKKERSRKERIQAGGGKPGRVTMSFLLLLLLPTRGRAFLFFPLSHACKTRGNGVCHSMRVVVHAYGVAPRKYDVQRGSRKQNLHAV